MNKSLFFVLLSLCLWGAAPGQRTLSLQSQSVLPNRVVLGESYDIFATLTNNDTLPILDTLDFLIHNENGIIPQNNSYFAKPNYANHIISLRAKESVPAFFRVEINPQYFKKGSDIIVIWPKTKLPVQDSIRWFIEIDEPLGIAQIPSDSVQVFYAENKLFFKNSAQKIGFEEVKIFSVDGAEILHQNTTPLSTLSVAHLPTGFYFAEIFVAGVLSKRIRFIRN